MSAVFICHLYLSGCRKWHRHSQALRFVKLFDFNEICVRMCAHVCVRSQVHITPTVELHAK